MRRGAFSLLEIIIATAVLAASAMVLSSLIGLGSKYGNRAEERTMAVSQAESLLDEYIAQLNNSNDRIEESTGELAGPPPRGFRISATPFEVGDANSSGVGESLNEPDGGLLRVTVAVFETSGSSASGEAKPLVEFSRLIRQPRKSQDSMSKGKPAGNSAGDATSVDPLQGAFP